MARGPCLGATEPQPPPHPQPQRAQPVRATALASRLPVLRTAVTLRNCFKILGHCRTALRHWLCRARARRRTDIHVRSRPMGRHASLQRRPLAAQAHALAPTHITESEHAPTLRTHWRREPWISHHVTDAHRESLRRRKMVVMPSPTGEVCPHWSPQRTTQSEIEPLDHAHNHNTQWPRTPQPERLTTPCNPRLLPAPSPHVHGRLASHPLAEACVAHALICRLSRAF